MKSFKDYVGDDMNTFINANEFATEHNIDGLQMWVVLDSDSNTEKNWNGVTEDGVYLNRISFFVAESVLGYRPFENNHMVFDGHPCIVASCDDDLGILQITLEVNRS
ncbi:MAG: hypothetical protein ACE3L7_04125 [Candidatus Pristimantibacillus sp.]